MLGRLCGFHQLVVAGAFHEPEQATNPLLAHNTAPVFTGNGRRLFVHRKLRLFGRDDVGAECAQVGNRLHVLITPIGCMTVLICKDFLDEDARVDNLLAEVPVDWVWVPSYGDETTLKGHKERARKLAKVTVGTSCAVAQPQNTAMKKKDQTQALLPGFGHPAGDAVPIDVATSGGLVEFGLAKQSVPAQAARPGLKRVK
jgi:predicted amidohydrolase